MWRVGTKVAINVYAGANPGRRRRAVDGNEAMLPWKPEL